MLRTLCCAYSANNGARCRRPVSNSTFCHTHAAYWEDTVSRLFPEQRRIIEQVQATLDELVGRRRPRERNAALENIAKEVNALHSLLPSQPLQWRVPAVADERNHILKGAESVDVPTWLLELLPDERKGRLPPELLEKSYTRRSRRPTSLHSFEDRDRRKLEVCRAHWEPGVELPPSIVDIWDTLSFRAMPQLQTSQILQISKNLRKVDP